MNPHQLFDYLYHKKCCQEIELSIATSSAFENGIDYITLEAYCANNSVIEEQIPYILVTYLSDHQYLESITGSTREEYQKIKREILAAIEQNKSTESIDYGDRMLDREKSLKRWGFIYTLYTFLGGNTRQPLVFLARR